MFNPCNNCKSKSTEYKCECNEYDDYVKEIQKYVFNVMSASITALQMVGYKVIINQSESIIKLAVFKYNEISPNNYNLHHINDLKFNIPDEAELLINTLADLVKNPHKH